MSLRSGTADGKNEEIYVSELHIGNVATPNGQGDSKLTGSHRWSKPFKADKFLKYVMPLRHPKLKLEQVLTTLRSKFDNYWEKNTQRLIIQKRLRH